MTVANLKTHELTKKQGEFIMSNSKYTLFSGGVGSGKSMAGCYKALLFALKYPKSTGIIANQTYRQLEDSTLKTFNFMPPPIDRYFLDV